LNGIVPINLITSTVKVNRPHAVLCFFICLPRLPRARCLWRGLLSDLICHLPANIRRLLNSTLSHLSQWCTKELF
jgi:hypothetical protein